MRDQSICETISKNDSQSSKSDSQWPKNIANQLAKVIHNYPKNDLHLGDANPPISSPVYICMCVYVCVYNCVCMYAYMYVCLYLCMYV